MWKSNNQGVKEEVGGAETGSQGREDSWQGSGRRTGAGKSVAGRAVVPHLHADKLGGTTRGQDRLRNPGFQCGEIKPQNL